MSRWSAVQIIFTAVAVPWPSSPAGPGGRIDEAAVGGGVVVQRAGDGAATAHGVRGPLVPVVDLGAGVESSSRAAVRSPVAWPSSADHRLVTASPARRRNATEVTSDVAAASGTCLVPFSARNPRNASSSRRAAGCRLAPLIVGRDGYRAFAGGHTVVDGLLQVGSRPDEARRPPGRMRGAARPEHDGGDQADPAPMATSSTRTSPTCQPVGTMRL